MRFSSKRRWVLVKFVQFVMYWSTPTLITSNTILVHHSKRLPFLFCAATNRTINCADTNKSPGRRLYSQNKPLKAMNDHTPMDDSFPTKLGDFINETNGAVINDEVFSKILSHTVPPLTSKSHKGSSGRVSILGGSEKYTGAPYYAAMSSLRVGADLSYVQCAMEASIPIKCYSPELMVESVYEGAAFESFLGKLMNANDKDGEKGEEPQIPEDNVLIQGMVKKVTDLMDRMHVLVIGPGLGRCPMVMKAAACIVSEAKKRRLPLVLDADAIYMLCLKENRNLLFCQSDESSRPVIILTPNVVEYKRLVDSIGDGSEEKMKKMLTGTIIVKKGQIDEIEYSSGLAVQKMICCEEGGLKRSGGIGDILSGTIGTFVAWNRILAEGTNDKNDVRFKDLVMSCWVACCVTKIATRHAFNKKKRSMTAPDIIEEIGSVMDYIASTTIKR